MKAFHGKKEIKAKYLRRVLAHYKADAIVKGRYWEDGKGCAVGCTIHSAKHKNYEIELGIPEWLALLEDRIFEGLPNERAKEWPVEFLSAIEIGADLSKVEAPFMIFILESLFNNFDDKTFPEVGKVIRTCIALYKKGNLEDSAEWSAARSAAWSAARSAAWSAARSAAWSAAESAASAASAAESAAWSAASAAESAAWSAARSAAWSAAESAASAAWSAAWSAASAAWSAASAAWSAARSAASAAWSAARSAEHVKFADKLLELLRKAK